MRRLIASALVMLSSVAMAGNQDAIQTCYTDKLSVPKGVGIETELFVIVDQTTLFNNDLKQSIADNIRPFLKAGNAISVLRFSAYTQGHYTDVLVSGKLDPELPKKLRDDTSKPILSKFDRCFNNQPRKAGHLVGSALKSAFGGSSLGIDKSDVIASLEEISSKVRQSAVRRKVVLIASDMLENSAVTSFYSKKTVRQINPEKEMSLVEQNKLFGDFGGAEVYVIGAGLLTEDAKQTKGTYRSFPVIQALSSFWKAWFQKSNANVIEFGHPALLSPIH